MVRGQWANLAKMLGFHPYSFFEGHPGILNDYRESGPRFNFSSERRYMNMCLNPHRCSQVVLVLMSHD